MSASVARKNWVLALILLLLACAFLDFVWPTPYDYSHANGEFWRVNRFTGVRETSTQTGWKTQSEQDKAEDDADKSLEATSRLDLGRKSFTIDGVVIRGSACSYFPDSVAREYSTRWIKLTLDVPDMKGLASSFPGRNALLLTMYDGVGEQLSDPYSQGDGAVVFKFADFKPDGAGISNEALEDSSRAESMKDWKLSLAKIR